MSLDLGILIEIPYPKSCVEPGNLVNILRNRELNFQKPNTTYLKKRQLYQHIYPNHTLYNIAISTCIFLKRFTPDGKHLVCFSRNQHALQLYTFLGPCSPKKPDIESPEAESGAIFQQFFSLKYEKILTFDPAELLCKDFCLVTSNQKHLILASACPSTASSAEACRYPSSLNCMANLDDITFYVMEIESGKICDRKTFKSDFIYLSHHSGVSLYGQFFAITSLQNQCIHVFQIKENGTFVGLRTIGWYNYDDDELELAKYEEFNEQFETRQRSHSAPPDAEWHGRAGIDLSRTLSLGTRLEDPSFSHRDPSLVDHPDEQSILFDDFKHTQPPLSGFKHRLLAYLYKKAKSVDDNGIALQNFYLTFSQFESLVLWKAQFLDETHLLVKLSSVECVTGRNTEGTNQTAFFVVYNIDTTMIIALYENTSEELLNLFEHHSESFRGPNYNEPANLNWTWSNNAFARLLLKKQQYAVRNARNGGPSQAVKRVLAALPYSPQSFSESPYFDPGLFSYDEKAISASDRPKPCQDFPIKFYLRSTGELKFKINTNVPNRGGSRVSKRYATFIVHPDQPFMISLQHTLMQPTVVNFHVRSGEVE